MQAWDDLAALEAGQLAGDALLREVYRLDVAKGLDPLNPRDFDVITARLAAQVAGVALPEQGRALREALRILDVDWVGMSDAARDKIVEAARAPFLGVPARVMPALQQGFRATSERIVRGTKKETALKYKLDIQTTFNQLDERVTAQTVESQGHFVRDAMGRRSEIFGARAKEIIARNLEHGYGNADIATELTDKLGALGRNRSYWEMLASVVACRARASAQVTGFQEAGIVAFLWESILDEATSLQCRFLHGRRFTVERALQVLTSIEGADDPEEIRSLNPFLNVGRGEGGGEALFIGSGAGRKLAAVVEENAVGQKDKQGKFGNALSDEALAKAGVCAPPAHGRCRSTIVPSDDSLAVPAPRPRPAPEQAPQQPVVAPPPTAPPAPGLPPIVEPAPDVAPPRPAPESLAAERALHELDALTADADGNVSVKSATALKPAPARGPTRPYEEVLARIGRPMDELVNKHGERFELLATRTDLSKVQATERTIPREAVAAKVNTAPSDRVVIVKSGGKYFLHDGLEVVAAVNLRTPSGGVQQFGNAVLVDFDKLARAARPNTQEWARDLRAKLGSGTEVGQAGVRDSLREQLRGLGVVTRDDRRGGTPGPSWSKLPEAGRGASKYDTKPDTDASLVGADAFHSWQGDVRTRQSVQAKAVIRLKDLADDPAAATTLKARGMSSQDLSTRYDGIRVLLHEEAHGCSKAVPSAYQKAGVGIEEAGTEIIARKATRELLGFSDHAAAFSLPTKTAILNPTSPRGARSYKYEGGHFCYREYIEGLFTAVAKHTGDADIHQRVEDAFLATRAWGRGEVYRTPEDQVGDFVRNLKSGTHAGGRIPPDAFTALVNELANPTGPMAKR